MPATQPLPSNHQLTGGTALILLGSIAVYLAKTEYIYASAVGIAIALFGVRLVATALSLTRERRIEDKARASLQLPQAWLVEQNFSLPSGEELDLLVTTPERNQFAIAILSLKGVLVKKQWLSGNETLVQLNGRKIKPDALTDITSSAGEIGATPVLWLPNTPSSKIFRLKSGVLVIQGPQKLLTHALAGKSAG